MLETWFSREHRRRKLAMQAAPGPLRDFLQTPWPSPDSDAREVEFAALDFETTGLDAQRDSILSAGWLALHGTAIDLGTAQHRILRSAQPLPEQSVLIHQLTDDAVAGGDRLENVLPTLLSFLAGRVLLAHHAQLEFQFLRQACRRIFGSDFVMPVVDTQWLALQSMRQRGLHYSAKDLRLFNLRQRYNLPRYRAHNALSDALATAELFVAQLAERAGAKPVRLKRLLVRM